MIKSIATSSAVVLVVGCTTVYQPAPVQGGNELQSVGIRIINEQPELAPRTYFTDGITTVKTDYRGWTDVIAKQFDSRIRTLPPGKKQGKMIALSIQAITCTGHWVPDCSISLLMVRGDGKRRVYTTDAFTGYPLTSAFEKAREGVVTLVFQDPEFLEYLAL